MANFVDDKIFRSSIDSLLYDSLHSDPSLFPSCHFRCIIDGKILYVTRNSYNKYLVLSNFCVPKSACYRFNDTPILPSMIRMGIYQLYISDDLYSAVRCFYFYLKYFTGLLLDNWFAKDNLPDNPELFY